MTIDYEALEAANGIMPTKSYPVPQLKAFFEDDEEPVWVCKALTGEQLARVQEAPQDAEKITAIASVLAKGKGAKFVKELNALMGNTDDVPDKLIRVHRTIQYGSVPECPENVAVRLAQFKPNIAWNLAKVIMDLTDEGANLGK